MPETLLFVVPTPIGNLGDITHRSIEILKSVDLILAEDTRKSRILLRKYEISTPLSSHHSFNEHKTLSSIITKLKSGQILGLISDAGTPAISDPGYLLIRECIKNDIPFEVLPGPTAFVPAIIKSGFPISSFSFEGFIPHKKGKQTKLKEIASEGKTVVMYESPYRLLKTLKQLAEETGQERNISVSRELTKIYEETITGTIQEVINHFEKNPVKGEIVIVLEGKKSV